MNKWVWSWIGIGCFFTGLILGVVTSNHSWVWPSLPLGFGFLCVGAYKEIKEQKEAERQRYEQWQKEKTEKEAKQKEAEKRRREELKKMRDGTWEFPCDEFGKECYKKGITDLSSEYGRQKSKIIVQQILSKKKVPKDAQEIYLSNERIEGFFNKAQTTILNEEQKRKEVVRQKEVEAEKELTKFAEYIGRDKWIAMIHEELDPIRGLGDRLISEGENALRIGSSYRESKMDWAIMGGIADGLAGPGAGIATAMDAQRENAAAQQRMQNMRNMGKAVMMAKASEGLRYRGEEKQLLKELRKAEKAAISEMSDEEVLQKLRIARKINITETGAFRISADISLRAPIDVFGKVPTKVDGTIAAKMYQDGELVGTALLVLPREGVCSECYSDKSMKTCGVKGIGLGNAVPGKPYEIRYEVHHLWIIEN